MNDNQKTTKIVIIVFLVVSIGLLIFGYQKGFIVGFSAESKEKYYKRINLEIGDTSIITSDIKDTEDVKIESSNEEVAVVNSDGKIEAKSKGTTVITVKDKEDKVIKKVEVVVDKDPKNTTEPTKQEQTQTTTKDEPKKQEETTTKDEPKKQEETIIKEEPKVEEPTKTEVPIKEEQPKVEEVPTKEDKPSVIEVKSIILNKTSVSLLPGSSEKIVATVSPTNSTNKTITWSSNNTSIATVSDGVITAKKEGTTTIVAKSNNNVTATVSVVVASSTVEVSDITVDKASITMNTATNTSVKATVSPSNATNKTLTWTSSNTNVATVDKDGNIRGTGAGTATITVKSNNNKSKTINVTVKSVERIHFIPTMANINSTGGHGDSILLESNGHFAMVDTGNSTAESRKNLLTYLNKLGVKKLDFILLTHLHSDHYGGINYLLKKNISVDTLYIKRYSESLGYNYATTYANLISCAKGEKDGCSKVSKIVYTQTIDRDTCPEKSNQAHSDFNCTANLTFQNMKIKLYNTAYVMKDGDIGPNGKVYKSYKKHDGEYETININYESIYEYITVNNHKVVLAADAVGEYSGAGNLFESDTWYSKIMKDSGTGIDVLKAPHHGDMNSDKNYSKLKPKSVVVTNTVKKLENKTGIKDYESYGARIYYAEYYTNTNDLKTLYADFTSNNVEFGRIKIYD